MLSNEVLKSWANVFSVSFLLNLGTVYIWPIYQSLDKRNFVYNSFFHLKEIALCSKFWLYPAKLCWTLYLEFFLVTIYAIFTYQFFEFKKAVCNSPKVVQHKKYVKNVQMKTPVLSQCSRIYVLWFRSCCSAKRNPILENQLTDFSLYYNNT